jgi:alkaline phosphatase
MMAEGAQIDYGGHANIVGYAVNEMLDFDRLVGEALKFADSNGETLVIVTADHETGRLTLPDGNLKTGYVDGYFSGVYENTEVYHKLMKLIRK